MASVNDMIVYQASTVLSSLVQQATGQKVIIPYQELPGNYNKEPEREERTIIIPYQELPGRGCLQQRTGQRRIGEMPLFRLLYPDG